jgi:hypothetical protein
MVIKDIEQLSIEELKKLGFVEWGMNNYKKKEILMLIPMNKLNIIPYGTKLYCISKEEIIFNKYHDNEYIDGKKNENYMYKDCKFWAYNWGIKIPNRKFNKI